MKSEYHKRIQRLAEKATSRAAIEYDGFWEAFAPEPDHLRGMAALEMIAAKDWVDGRDDSLDEWEREDADHEEDYPLLLSHTFPALPCDGEGMELPDDPVRGQLDEVEPLEDPGRKGVWPAW